MRRTGTVLHPAALLLTALLLWPCLTHAELQGDPAATAGPAESRAEPADTVRVGVLYLSNRSRDGNGSVANGYNGDRGKPHFGRCEVEFTPIPIINQVASRLPFYLRSESNLVSRAEQADPLA